MKPPNPGRQQPNLLAGMGFVRTRENTVLSTNPSGSFKGLKGKCRVLELGGRVDLRTFRIAAKPLKDEHLVFRNHGITALDALVSFVLKGARHLFSTCSVEN